VASALPTVVRPTTLASSSESATSRAAGRPAPARQRSRSTPARRSVAVPARETCPRCPSGSPGGRSELTASLGPTLGGQEVQRQVRTERAGSTDARHSAQPQLQAVTHTFRPAAFGFLQNPSASAWRERRGIGESAGGSSRPPLARELHAPRRERAVGEIPASHGMRSDGDRVVALGDLCPNVRVRDALGRKSAEVQEHLLESTRGPYD
jgi:hypothetical protein